MRANITVNTVFVGKQSDQDAFIDLIVQRTYQKMLHNKQSILANSQSMVYTVPSSEMQNAQKRRTT